MSNQFPHFSGPATPGRKGINDYADNYTKFENLSTTPAGPPPSSSGSFRLSGPPPTNFGDSLMSIESPIKVSSFSQLRTQRSLNSRQMQFLSPEIRNQKQPPELYSVVSDGSSDEARKEDYVKKIQGEDDIYSNSEHDGHEYDGEENLSGYGSDSGSSRQTGSQCENLDLALAVTGNTEQQMVIENPQEQQISSQNNIEFGTSKYEKIARDIYSCMDDLSVDEPDDLILATEAIISRLYQENFEGDGVRAVVEEKLSVLTQELTKLWDNYHKQIAIHHSEEYTTTVGPGPKSANFSKANFLANLALKIHHPGKASSSYTAKEIPIPQTLLEWMESYHNPYPNQYEEVQAHKPYPANHTLFWDTIFNCLIRGKVIVVTNMIKSAGWRHISNDSDKLPDNTSSIRYSDTTLRNIEQAMHAAIEILVSCPATHGDWNSRNKDWKLFRLRTSQALEDLKHFTQSANQIYEDNKYSKANSTSYSQAAKKAESLIPWNLQQNLVTLYQLLMGDMSVILANSQDWCEATIGLVVWWDEDIKNRNMPTGHFQEPLDGLHRLSSSDAFDRKLRISFEIATSDSTDLQIDSANPVEVALASLFEGDSESVIGFLRGWSGPVSSAVAEIASFAGWLPRGEEKSLISMESLDQDDLDLLGINPPSTKIDGPKDRTLIAYANSLSQRKELKYSMEPPAVMESWELSILILGRLDSTERSEEILWELLQRFPLQNSSTVKKLWVLLNNISLPRHAEKVAQTYADELAEKSRKYGEALYFYALAHMSDKVKDVLDLLISYSLVQSLAYPPEADVDDQLRSFIISPQSTLTDIAVLDIDAAKLLQKSLSGYATLRKFYDLRDGDVYVSAEQLKLGPLARKRQAAIALITVIDSSSDHIRGGLYDRECGAVVNVDFLLALLGESLRFVGQEDFILTAPQIEALLRAIEDLETVSSRVYAACAEFLQSVMASNLNYQTSMPDDSIEDSIGSDGRNLKASLQKNQLLMNSELAAEDRVKRGWDWRQCVSANTTGKEILWILRLGLAKDLARAWLMEVDNKW